MKKSGWILKISTNWWWLFIKWNNMEKPDMELYSTKYLIVSSGILNFGFNWPPLDFRVLVHEPIKSDGRKLLKRSQFHNWIWSLCFIIRQIEPRLKQIQTTEQENKFTQQKNIKPQILQNVSFFCCWCTCWYSCCWKKFHFGCWPFYLLLQHVHF